ncbi:hypothetical protein TNCV_990601 [Trichonephila clavipes]|nr:hypothetical protein TNCV_990601 [Trichonephila clavipes]
MLQVTAVAEWLWVQTHARHYFCQLRYQEHLRHSLSDSSIETCLATPSVEYLQSGGIRQPAETNGDGRYCP